MIPLSPHGVLSSTPFTLVKKEKREAGAKKQPEVGGAFVGSDIFLGNGNSNMFYVHPYLRK